MRIANRYSLIVACLRFAALAGNAAAPALAQEDPSKYPARPIHIIVGFAAGGGNDIIARVFGQKLAESLGQPVRTSRVAARSLQPSMLRSPRLTATHC